MSYIQSRIRCDSCGYEMNVAFGIVGMQQIAGWPETCPKCGRSAFTKIADGWKLNPVPALSAPQPTPAPTPALEPELREMFMEILGVWRQEIETDEWLFRQIGTLFESLAAAPSPAEKS